MAMAIRRPGQTAKYLDVPDTLPTVSRYVLGTAAGSTLGFLPGVAYDGYQTAFGKNSSYNGSLLEKLSCMPSPCGGGHLDHSKGGDERMISKSLDSLAAQSMELKKRVDNGMYHMPSWAEYKVYKAHDAIKDALSSSFTTAPKGIRVIVSISRSKGIDKALADAGVIGPHKKTKPLLALGK